MIDFTDYGVELAQSEPLPTFPMIGAQAHANAMGYDSGLSVIVTGQYVSSDGARHGWNYKVRSVFAAFAVARANRAARHAWHILPNGQRKLIFRVES